nr:MAG TPA: hypothetical protein [Bacteriophage sp.]
MTICYCGMSAGDSEHIKIMRLKNIMWLNLTNGVI